MRQMIAWAMRASGWVVEEVATAEDAFCEAVAFEPDAIVMDLHLPSMSGLDAIRGLRTVDSARRVPIVVCTAFASDKARAEAHAAGCEGFLAKPFEPDVLRFLLERLVRGAEGA